MRATNRSAGLDSFVLAMIQELRDFVLHSGIYWR